MTKKLAILGAGAAQVKLVEAAKELGYHTVVVSIEGNYPAFACADEVLYKDITNPEEVYEAVKDMGLDGVATCCLDTGIITLGYLCDKLNLTGLKHSAAMCCNNKRKMKEALVKGNVNTAKYIKVKTWEESEKATNEIGLPVVFKALDLQGSKGVFICHEMDEVKKAFEEAVTQSRLDEFIIEEYLIGNELGSQAFIYNDEILFVLPHGDETYMSKTAIPVGHYAPADIPEDVYNAAVEESVKAIRAIGLNNCAVNIDLIERDGKIYLVELTGRVGATCLPELVSIYFGLNYYKMIAMMAVGENPCGVYTSASHPEEANISHMLMSEKTGTVKSISIPQSLYEDPDIYDLSLIIKVGDHVDKFASAKDRIGQIIVKGKTLEECRNKLKDSLSQIEIEVE